MRWTASQSNPAADDRKRRLAKLLLGKAKRRSIRYNEHLTGDGPSVLDHVCRRGLEGIVSKWWMRPIAAPWQREKRNQINDQAPVSTFVSL